MNNKKQYNNLNKNLKKLVYFLLKIYIKQVNITKQNKNLKNTSNYNIFIINNNFKIYIYKIKEWNKIYPFIIKINNQMNSKKEVYIEDTQLLKIKFNTKTKIINLTNNKNLLSFKIIINIKIIIIMISPSNKCIK